MVKLWVPASLPKPAVHPAAQPCPYQSSDSSRSKNAALPDISQQLGTAGTHCFNKLVSAAPAVAGVIAVDKTAAAMTYTGDRIAKQHLSYTTAASAHDYTTLIHIQACLTFASFSHRSRTLHVHAPLLLGY
jgi:hypothetical protein